MTNEQNNKEFWKVAFNMVLEKLAQRSVGSDNFSDVDFTSETFIRDFSLSNVYKLLYQIAGEGIIRGQLKNGTISPNLLDKLPQGYDDAIQAAIRRKIMSEMAAEWDKFAVGKFDAMPQEVQQRMVKYRQTLQQGIDNASSILSDYVNKHRHLQKAWDGKDNDKILNQLVSNMHPDYGTYGSNLASMLNQVFSATLFVKLVFDDVEKNEKGIQKALGSWLGVLEGFAKPPATQGYMQWLRTILTKTTLVGPSRTLLGGALRGGLVGVLLSLEYEAVYNGTKWILSEGFTKLGYQELYDQEWFVESANTILPIILNDLTGDKLQTVIGLNYLLTTTFKNLSVEDTADLFGDTEYKDFNVQKVIAVYQKVYALLSGNENTQSIGNLDDLAIALKDNAIQNLFKYHRGSQILVVNEFNFDTVYSMAEKDSASAIAVRYALRNLNPFVILSTSIDYNQFNKDGELDLYSPTNPNGMTETYIQKRAEMLKAALFKGLNETFIRYYEDKQQNIRGCTR